MTARQVRTTIEVAPLREYLLVQSRVRGTLRVVEDMAHDVSERHGVPFESARRRAFDVLAGRYDRLSVWWADRFACSLGRHPSLIWNEAWWEAARLQDYAGDELDWE